MARVRRLPRSIRLGLIALVVLIPALALAQGVGIFSRSDCTTLTGTVTGQSFCFDQTANVVKYWTGARWVSGTATQAGINNVRDFGAKGDGTTDDTAAINATFLAATANLSNGGWVLLPVSGTYKTTGVFPTQNAGSPFNLTILGAGLPIAAPVSGQTNLINNLFQPVPTGTQQQIGLGVFTSGIASGGSSAGRIGFFASARTGGATGAGTGNNVWAVNTVAQQNPGDTTAQIVGIENDLNSDKADATLDMSPAQVGFSAVSSGSKKAGIAFNVSGTPQWIEGYRVDQGAIATGNWAFRYKGDGVNGGVGIRADGTIENGFFASSIGSPNELHLLNNKNIQGLNQAGVSLLQMMGTTTANNIAIDTGNNGTTIGGGLALGGPTGGVKGVGTINAASSVILNNVVFAKSTGAPTCIDKCGSASLITATGTDSAFNVTLGTSLTNTFVMKFATTYAAAPACVGMQNGAPQAGATVMSINTTATGVTFNLVGTPNNSTVYSGICHGVTAG